LGNKGIIYGITNDSRQLRPTAVFPTQNAKAFPILISLFAKGRSFVLSTLLSKFTSQKSFIAQAAERKEIEVK